MECKHSDHSGVKAKSRKGVVRQALNFFAALGVAGISLAGSAAVCAQGEVAGMPETSPASGPAAGRGYGRPPGPPPEAVEACQGKYVGAQVTFTDPKGNSHSAVCRSIRGGLVAVPAGGRMIP